MTAAAATRTAEPFPWEAVLHAGLGRLRLSPDQFWAMTPRELTAALTPPCTSSALRRGDLAALMAAFPDNDRYG
ncbi:rcc01693 family protein [Rhizobium sp. YIM 134829]|uniref:rcc01693 family protein n=1 Tax=Rhizobium sp. YIM 134829 TaxID=3390453 RepID=UPI00397C2D4B